MDPNGTIRMSSVNLPAEAMGEAVAPELRRDNQDCPTPSVSYPRLLIHSYLPTPFARSVDLRVEEMREVIARVIREDNQDRSRHQTMLIRYNSRLDQHSTEADRIKIAAVRVTSLIMSISLAGCFLALGSCAVLALKADAEFALKVHSHFNKKV